MSMKKLSSDGIKQIIFNILCEFDQYCADNNLYYSLCGGTLLGAIRHKGFIPWDDDIDVFMPRYDYMRLQKLVKEMPFPKQYKLISYEEGTASFPFAKILDLNTKVEEKCMTNDEYLWIDIFPVDGLSDDIEENKKILTEAHKNKNAYARSLAKFGEGTTIARAILKTPALIYHKLIGHEKYAANIHTLCTKYDFDHSDYVASISWAYGPGEMMRKEEFLQSVKVPFNGREFNAISCWDSYLTTMYGDYMKLPPENKRINHLMDAYILTDETLKG